MAECKVKDHKGKEIGSFSAENSFELKYKIRDRCIANDLPKLFKGEYSWNDTGVPETAFAVFEYESLDVKETNETVKHGRLHF